MHKPWDKRLFDYLYEQLERYPQEKSVGDHGPNGWQYWSTQMLADIVQQTSFGLMQAGIQPGDRVATVVYRTSPEWVAFDLALLQIGALNIPMYPTISPREYAYILQESGARFCVVGDQPLYLKVLKAQEECPSLESIYCFTTIAEAPHWTALHAPTGDADELKRRMDAIQPGDLATVIYTSGTTGNPKGVMLSHRNIAYNTESLRSMTPFTPGDRVLSFLPVSHIFERAAVYYYLGVGAQVSFTDTLNLGGEKGDFQAIQPHYFAAVPRLLEKVYDKILATGQALKSPKRNIFLWALGLADQWDFDQRPGLFRQIQLALADRLVYAKWREALGGCIKGVFLGASACPVRIMRTFNAASIPIREGYGLTEAAPALSFSRFEAGGAMLGTVGPLMDETRILLDPDPSYREGEGEILAQSPGVMLGYYKQPDKTAEALVQRNGETWLATGDIGRLVTKPNGRTFLQITDRKKELLKTSGGKYVAPGPIEVALKEHYLVEHAIVVGENRKFVSAIIVPNEDGLRDWCKRHHVTWTNFAENVRHPAVHKRFQMLLERVNPQFSQVEQIKKFTLVPGPWEAVKADGADAELTPTLKLKRRVILEKYAQAIDDMYA
ncbi:MAG: AMP-dependent synthetase/ligase [Saprospiraceae bacterium]